jgi:hypothetical protein
MRALLVVLCLVAFPVFAGYNIGKVQEQQILFSVGDTTADVTSGAAGVHEFFAVPANCAILDVAAYVETALLGSTAAVVGDSNNDDGYLENGFGTVIKYHPEKVKLSTYAGAYQGAVEGASFVKWEGGKYYAAADTLDFKLTGTATVGKIRFFVKFMQLK